MTPQHIDRVFGRGRLKMVTGAHVEVFREAAAPGESRRYTKRFLATADGDYQQWTEREWRILARLIGHGARCIPDVVQYDRDAHGTKLVQTYDAGATVDQWATLLPVERDGRVHGHVFEDCAHWWALAHHCLVALDEIHSLELVHLDIKGDNLCIPVGPASFDPFAPGQRLFPVFRKLALIDFAFSLVSGETLTTPLPIGWQQDYDYQSPRLLRALEAGRMGDLGPTENLDWRCDMYSVAAMLQRYLPAAQIEPGRARGWTEQRFDAAKSLIMRIREAHDDELTSKRPHADLIAETSAHVRDADLVQSLEQGWTLAREAAPASVSALPLTPVTPATRLAAPIRLVIPPREDALRTARGAGVKSDGGIRKRVSPERRRALPLFVATVLLVLGALPFVAGDAEWLDQAVRRMRDTGRMLAHALRDVTEPDAMSRTTSAAASIATEGPTIRDETPVPAADEAERSNVAAPADPPPNQATESTRQTPSVPQATESAAASPTLQRSRADESFAAQIEAYRHKTPPRSARTTRAPSSPAASQSRANAGRMAEPSRRTQLASARNVPRVPKAGASASQRAPVARASERATDSAAAAPSGATIDPIAAFARMDATTAPSTARVDAAPAANGPSQEPRPVAPTTHVAPVPAVSASVPDARAATPSAAPPAASAPTVEAQRAASAPATASPTAPIVEASRPSASQIVQAPRPSPPPAVAELPRQPVQPALSEPQRAMPPSRELRSDDAYRSQALWALENVVPRTSTQSRVQIARVLWLASNAYHPKQEDAVADAAALPGVATDVPFVARDVAPADARRLHEEARQAYWSRRQAPEALELELRAFGANPNDPEIAGHLAFLHLKIAPAQPERALQLALHAIGLRNAQYPTGRPDDWTTFAIASMLTGRSSDARHALYASLALTRNADRVCRSAVAALAVYGERMREPVEALLYRVHTQGRGDESPYCAWPPNRGRSSSVM